MGKITKTAVRALCELVRDGEIKAAAFRDDALVSLLLREGCIRKEQITKSRAKYVLIDEKGLRMCCADYDVQMHNLEALHETLQRGELYVKPSDEIRRYGEDHHRKRNLWKGFFVKGDSSILYTLNGESYIAPRNHGLLVENGEGFRITGIESLRLWVVENYECFVNIKWLRLFGYDDGRNLIVCRWPTSSMARESYGRWPVMEKKYFGDLDLAGINIFQSEFAAILGSESFFLPPSFTEDIKHGSLNLFTNQKGKYKNLRALTDTIESCLNLIISEQKGLLQEYYLTK